MSNFNRFMKFVVTGGAGFIGNNIVRLLISRGHEVLVVDNLHTGKTTVNPVRNREQRTDVDRHSWWRRYADGACGVAGLVHAGAAPGWAALASVIPGLPEIVRRRHKGVGERCVDTN